MATTYRISQISAVKLENIQFLLGAGASIQHQHHSRILMPTTCQISLPLLLIIVALFVFMAQGNDDEQQPQQPQQDETLQLPPPSFDSSRTKLDLSSGSADLTDKLGPLVINKDGTTSRIVNWPRMTEMERERTLRIISKRNRERLAKLKEEL